MRNMQIEIARREVSERGRQNDYAAEGRNSGVSSDPRGELPDRELRRAVLEAWQRKSDDAEVRMFWQRVCWACRWTRSSGNRDTRGARSTSC